MVSGDDAGRLGAVGGHPDADDPRLREHPDWGTRIYNYGRNEVANYLIGSALFWLDRYHIDGLRLDAVASMLYRDYGRRGGDWVPNQFGGRENLEAVDFLKRLNETVYAYHPDVMTIAEESTAWPMVSRPAHLGGLGFGFKWNMGWMHDLLEYMAKEPIHRKFHHNDLTFGLLYAWTENFILPLSHDEVVYGKGSLHRKMPGDDWQRFANLRAFFGFMYGHPGKKLLFMGGEFGQWNEWNFDTSLQWDLLQWDTHRGLQKCLADLNKLYRRERSLHEVDFNYHGFQWIDCHNYEDSTLSYIRLAKDPGDYLVVCHNFTPVPRAKHRLGVPEACWYEEVFNSDSLLSCVACYACLAKCPRGIRLTEVLLPLVKEQVFLRLSDTPGELNKALENTLRYGNPMGESSRKRAAE